MKIDIDHIDKKFRQIGAELKLRKVGDTEKSTTLSWRGLQTTYRGLGH